MTIIRILHDSAHTLELINNPYGVNYRSKNKSTDALHDLINGQEWILLVLQELVDLPKIDHMFNCAIILGDPKGW